MQDARAVHLTTRRHHQKTHNHSEGPRVHYQSLINTWSKKKTRGYRDELYEENHGRWDERSEASNQRDINSELSIPLCWKAVIVTTAQQSAVHTYELNNQQAFEGLCPFGLWRICFIKSYLSTVGSSGQHHWGHCCNILVCPPRGVNVQCWSDFKYEIQQRCQWRFEWAAMLLQAYYTPTQQRIHSTLVYAEVKRLGF